MPPTAVHDHEAAAFALRQLAGCGAHCRCIPLIHIYTKLGVDDRTAAVTVALERRIITLLAPPSRPFSTGTTT